MTWNIHSHLLILDQTVPYVCILVEMLLSSHNTAHATTYATTLASHNVLNCQAGRCLGHLDSG